ncbi:MAG: BMP family ABC transporter substrate-binding protein [Pseudomonadota bacterium]
MTKISVLRRGLLSAALAGLVMTAAPLPPAQALEIEGEPKIAFIYAATARDGGWNEALDNARMAVESELGVKIAVVESIKEEATALKNAIDLFVSRGFNVIVATGYGYSEGILEAAKANPEVAFMNASGATNHANLEGFYVRTYQAWYLAGMAAAGTSKSGKIGIIGGFPVGVVNWDVNAFALGAQSINPDIETTVVYTNSWWDPVKEGEVAEAMLDQGVDVIGNNLSSAAPFIAAEKRGAKSVGFQLDMSKHAPTGHLTSVMFNWDQHLVPTIKTIADGAWEPNEWGAFPGMKDGVVSLSPLSEDIPADVRAKIEAKAAAIMAGETTPFDGPVLAQDGSAKVAEGESLDDGALWSMDFLVKGVKGSLN